ncbi:hypothetical protein [Paeniglutamicibacter sp. Y32M11]|uniref:hypothetical protein n=1 Tax=Paeniglutamicibacter sp. Y32M11 TaxID=2853258 RepID=UPI001C532446|nr:hypothetical protein [Paeniglutamicibacter sp. Y32M11]QXQ10991.1 hypothetical protein KUF55_03400 [Paeniglutamicibacter sp. Y32M11]
MIAWATITDAIFIAQGGDPNRGHELLLGCWNSTNPTDHAQRCIVAHYLADTETEVENEVLWDELALVEHGFLTDEDLAPLGITSTDGLRPSLHLNLADGYHRQGRIELAREQLALGQSCVQALNADGYGQMIGKGLDNLALRIAATDTSSMS